MTRWTQRFVVLMVLGLVLFGNSPTWAQSQIEKNCVEATGDESISACSEVIRRNPKADWAYNNRGNAWQDKGDFDRAISDYNKAIELNPKNAAAYNNRGNAWGGKGDNDRAISDYNKAIELNPKYVDAYYNRGRTWFDKGDDDRAISDYSKAIELNPKYAEAYVNRGSAWAGKGDFDRAISDFNKAIELNPKLAEAYRNRGIAWYHKGDNDRAFSDFNKAIELNPKFAWAYYGRGFIWEQKGSLHNALGDFIRFNELAPNDPDGPKKIAEIREKLKSSSPAQVASNQVQQQQPSNSATSTNRVALLIGNSKYKHAPRLENPGNDVQLIGKSLRDVGFSRVEIEENLTAERMRKVVRDFGVIADAADFALIYYAGHAIQVGGTNYLMPIDSRLKTDRDIDFETVEAGKLLVALSGSKKLRVLVLDSCRENPFEQEMRRTLASRSIGRGLSKMEPSMTGELIVFAAAAGALAADGQGSNSPFATAFANRIRSNPPIEIRRLFDYVRDDVLKLTKRQQQPFTYGSLSAEEDFFFSR